MAKTAIGTFEVKLNPLNIEIEHLGRMSIDKTFKGELNGSSSGEMLSASTSIKTSAGYVAMERFSGDLEGKKGSFILQHFGIMHAGENKLILEIIPNSGTEELENIEGTMRIERKANGHQYTLEYDI